jgi:hypothetical protein
VSTAALGGILYKTGTAVLVVSFRAVLSSTIHELISVQRVSVGLAYFATTASRQVALATLEVSNVSVVGFVFIRLQAMLVTEIPIVTTSVAGGFVTGLFLKSGLTKAAARTAVLDNS